MTDRSVKDLNQANMILQHRNVGQLSRMDASRHVVPRKKGQGHDENTKLFDEIVKIAFEAAMDLAVHTCGGEAKMSREEARRIHTSFDRGSTSVAQQSCVEARQRESVFQNLQHYSEYLPLIVIHCV